jgi:hypothetical protein
VLWCGTYGEFSSVSFQFDQVLVLELHETCIPSIFYTEV